MESIIEKARKCYPNDRTQQFYRIIKPSLDETFAKANDNDIKRDSYEEEANGLQVMRQFFPYENKKYCFWICLFPFLTEDGKKNAFYGIERENNGEWQALWSEAENNYHLWFKLRIAAKMMDEDDLLANLNPFELAIKNAPYNTDIFEQGKIYAKIMTDYSVRFNGYRKKEINKGNLRFKFDYFKLYDNLYLWTVFYKNNLIEGFRLDVIYDLYTSFVLCSNVANDEQIGAQLLLRIFMENE